MQIPYIGSHRFQGFLISTLNLKTKYTIATIFSCLRLNFRLTLWEEGSLQYRKRGWGVGVCEVVIDYLPWVTLINHISQFYKQWKLLPE